VDAAEGAAMTEAAIASLVVGVVIGFVGQRSRMCFVGGIRDWILVRDTELLKGLISFVLAGWVLFPMFALIGGAPAGGFAGPVPVTILLAVVGGCGVGAVSIRAEGCPFRQHVLSGQGSGNAMVYLVGFLSGAVVFHVFVAPIVGRILI
jgi:hypothetical protein